MEMILSLLNECREEKRIFTNLEIIKIVEYFNSIYEVHVIVEFIDNSKYFMYYSLESNTIKINNNFIASINYIYTNYQILFALIHEFRHVMQYKYSKEKDDLLARYYKVSFDFISKKNIFNLAFYNMNHDYFIIEKNANIVASYYLVLICKMLGDNIYEVIYSNSLDNYLNSINDSKYESVERCLIGDNLDLKDKYQAFFNGLIKDKEILNEQKELLLMSKK